MKLKDYARQQGVSYRTAWRWWKAGKLPGRQMDTGTILVEPEAAASSSGAQRVAIYARVSSAENTCNLESQAERLAAYCAACGYQVADGRHINADVNGSYTLFCHVGMALCRSAAGNREIMDEVRVYVIRRPHGVVPEFLGPTPKMTKEG